MRRGKGFPQKDLKATNGGGGGHLKKNGWSHKEHRKESRIGGPIYTKKRGMGGTTRIQVPQSHGEGGLGRSKKTGGVRGKTRKCRRVPIAGTNLRGGKD